MIKLTEREKDVIAVAKSRLEQCVGGRAPGPFVVADKENAALWLQTLVKLSEAAATG